MAIGWIEDSYTRFAILNRDLSVVAQSGCFPGHWGFDLAATSTGWLMAASAPGGNIDLYAFDAVGHPRGNPRHIPAANPAMPFLIPRSVAGVATGGPLFSWSAPSDAEFGTPMVVLLDDDGNELTRPRVLPSLGAALFIGDAFLVLQDLPENAGQTRVAVSRLQLDGSLQSPRQPTEDFTAGASLIAAGSDIFLAYYNTSMGAFSDVSRWVRLDASGAAIGTPVTFSTAQASFSLVALGDSAFALGSSAKGLRMAPLSTGAAFDIVDAMGTGGATALSTVGGDAFVAWTEPVAGWVGVARVHR